MTGSRVVHLEWRKPARQLLASLLFPVLLALIVDAMLGTMPLATIVVSLVCIPLSTILVIRAVLAEMDRLIEVVAPQEPTPANELASESIAGGNLPDACA